MYRDATFSSPGASDLLEVQVLLGLGGGGGGGLWSALGWGALGHLGRAPEVGR